MDNYTHQPKQEQTKTFVHHNSQQQNESQPTFQFVDNRPEAIFQRKLQEGIKNSPQFQEQQAIQKMADNSSQAQKVAQFQEMAKNHTAQTPPIIQKKENKTGLPDNLKSGIENLSGYSMDDVKVHYNSSQPAQLQAHAFAQGTDIHIASGQEKHLPHEAWHVVQQKQGRVKPTMQLKGLKVNNDKGLEREADVMGAKSQNYQTTSSNNDYQKNTGNFDLDAAIIQRAITVEYDSKSKEWSLSGRADFIRKTSLDKLLIAEWNSRNPGELLDVKDYNFSDEELDRCHVTSWFEIRTYTENYLNGQVTKSDFEDFTDNLYGASPSGDWYDNMVAWRDDVTSNPDEDNVEGLLKELNSAPPNLRLDHEAINKKIKEHIDVPFYLTDRNKWKMTEDAKFKLQEDYESKMLFDETDEKIYSSSSKLPIEMSDIDTSDEEDFHPYLEEDFKKKRAKRLLERKDAKKKRLNSKLKAANKQAPKKKKK